MPKLRMCCYLAAHFILCYFTKFYCTQSAHFFANYDVHGEQSLANFPNKLFVEDIIVQSNISLDNYVYYLINLKKHTTITRNDLANACFYLQQWNRFKHINISLKSSNNGYIIYFDLSARWLVADVQLANVYWRKAHIQNLYLMQPGDAFDEKKHQESLENYRRYYQEQGYINVRVSAQQKKDLNNKYINISIKINKGPHFYIKKTHLDSNEVIEIELIKRLQNILTKTLKNRSYNTELLTLTQYKLYELLLQAGYACSHVKLNHTRIGNKNLLVTAFVTLENKNKISIQGNHVLTNQELIKKLGVYTQQSTPINAPLIAHIINHWYITHGFDAATVDLNKSSQGWNIQINEGKKNIKLSPAITPIKNESPNQPLALFGKTIIRGAIKIHPYTLLKELPYQEGNTWNAQKIERALKNIQELGILRTGSLYPLFARDPKEQQPMILSVVQDDPFELNAHIGGCLGNQTLGNTYTLGTSFMYKNIGDHPHCTWLDIQLSRFSNDISLHYQQPHIKNKPLLLQFDCTYYSLDQRSIGPSNPRLYTAQTCSVVGQLKYQTETNQYACNTGIQAIAIKHLDKKVAQVLDFTQSNTYTYQPFFFIQPYIQLKLIDNTTNPHMGSISTLQTAVYAAFKNNQPKSFIKIIAEQSFFIPFLPKLTGAIRLRLGHIFTPSWRNLLPPERFYLGGPCSVRSYQPDYTPPYGILDYNGTICPIAKGGKSLINFNAELRWHINRSFIITPFFDIGALQNGLSKYWCWSNGIGTELCYLTPLGPLRFDIGWKLGHSPRDLSSYAWFLTFGHAF